MASKYGTLCRAEGEEAAFLDWIALALRSSSCEQSIFTVPRGQAAGAQKASKAQKALCQASGWQSVVVRSLACLFLCIFKIRHAGGMLSPGAKGEGGEKDQFLPPGKC